MCLDFRHIVVESARINNAVFDAAPDACMQDVQHLIACAACTPLGKNTVHTLKATAFLQSGVRAAPAMRCWISCMQEFGVASKAALSIRGDSMTMWRKSRHMRTIHTRLWASSWPKCWREEVLTAVDSSVETARTRHTSIH